MEHQVSSRLCLTLSMSNLRCEIEGEQLMLNAKVDTTLAGAVPNKISTLTLQAFCVYSTVLHSKKWKLRKFREFTEERSKEILSTTRVSQNHTS